VQRRRPDLRLVVSSATLQAESLREFFDPARDSAIIKENQRGPGMPVQRTPAILSIEGRTHPVEVRGHMLCALLVHDICLLQGGLCQR